MPYARVTARILLALGVLTLGLSAAARAEPSPHGAERATLERSLLELEHELASHFRDALVVALDEGDLVEAGHALHAFAGHLVMAERLLPSAHLDPRLRARVADHVRALAGGRLPRALDVDVRALERALADIGVALRGDA